MGDISIRALSVDILARDLEAQSQTTGFESRQTASQKLVNRKIGLYQKDTQVWNVSEVLKFQYRNSTRLLSVTTTQI